MNVCSRFWNCCDEAREMLINLANEVKHEAHGTQQPGHIDKIGEGASTMQRSDSLVQSINQHFPSSGQLLAIGCIEILNC